MGTRGVFGFHKDGVDKITYNHYDSYPTGLGEEVKKFIVNHPVEELNKIFKRIKLVDDKKPPTEKQIKECEKFTDLTVSKQSTTDWYCLLRHAQDNPEAYAEGLNYMEDYASSLKSSLHCEWGYVINLTTNRLEIYRGFQHKPQDNRYRIEKRHDNLGDKYEGYFNCALIREVPLSQVKNFDMKKFEKEVEKEEEDE
jgi:hypothetical protein